MNFLNMPTDIIVKVLNLFSLRDVQKLDSSFSNSADRANLAFCYERACIAHLGSTDSVKWVLNRSMKVSNVILHRKNNAKYFSGFTFLNLLSKISTSLVSLTIVDNGSKNLICNTSREFIFFNNLQSLNLFYVTNEFSELFLNNKYFVCRNLKDITLKVVETTTIWDCLANLWVNCPLLKSIRVRNINSGITILSICRERKLLVIQCGEHVNDTQIIKCLQSCQNNWFESLWLGNINFPFSSQLIDLIVEKCPNLKCLKLDDSNNSYPIAERLKEMLYKLTAVCELSLNINFFSREFKEIFDEKLGNISKLSVYFRKSVEIDTLIHILAINRNIKQFNADIGVRNGIFDEWRSAVEQWLLSSENDQPGRQIKCTNSFDYVNNWEKLED